MRLYLTKSVCRMEAKLLSCICVLLLNGIQAEEEFDTRFKTLEAALHKDNLRFIRLEENVNHQKEMLKDQSLTIYNLRNQLMMQTDTLKEQENTIKQLNELLSAQLVLCRLLKNDFETYTTRNHDHAAIYTPRNESLVRMVPQTISVRGAADQKWGNQQRKQKLTADYSGFRARIDRGVESTVAFTAIKWDDQNGIGVNQNILFDRVIINEGGGFHAQHGVFVAPVSGYYLFATSLLYPPTSNQHFHGGLMHNGNLIAIAFGTNDIWAQGSQTVVLKVTSGDEVWIKNLDYEHVSVRGGTYSSFTGILLLML